MDIEELRKMQKSGLCIFPCNNEKEPNIKTDQFNKEYSWRKYSFTKNPFVINDNNIKLFQFVGLSCGEASGNLEGIDIDSKYELDVSLFEGMKELVTNTYDDLWEKLTIIKTISNGYHLLYFCDTIESNQSLAKREATREEKNNFYLELKKKGKPKEQSKKIASRLTKVLIETRGEGGYLATVPSKGYSLVQGTLYTIPFITEEERDVLINCARTFNTLQQEEFKKLKEPYQNTSWSGGKKPWEDYNERITAMELAQLLEKHGWQVNERLSDGQRIYLKRPGDTKTKQSANIKVDCKVFTAHSSSTIFSPQKPYSASAVFAQLECNGDFVECGRKLLEMGYGEKQKKEYSNDFDTLDESFKVETFTTNQSETDQMIRRFMKGDLPMGLETGWKLLDEYFRFKPGKYVVWLGHANVGKSTLLWYLLVVANHLHGWKSLLYSTENDGWVIKKEMMQFKAGKNITLFTDAQFNMYSQWFEENFTIIEHDDLLAYNQILKVAEAKMLQKKYDCLLIDPYNTLPYNWENIDKRLSTHDYHHHVSNVFKQWSKKNNCCIYLNTHPNTEAMRQIHPKGHDMEGHVKPPISSQAEGGGKWIAKCDDFVVLHRYVKHPNMYNRTIIDVQKVKETFSGGQPMMMDNYFELTLRNSGGFVGFFDDFNENPLVKKKKDNIFGEENETLTNKAPF